MRTILVGLLAVAIPAVGVARAQGPVVVSGVVEDTSGFALDAEIAILSLKRSVMSGADGRFQLGAIRPGRYAISARRIGFYAQTKTIVVTDTGATVKFTLVPLQFRLPPVVKAAKPGGLGGVIGDTAYAAVTGAEVQIVSTSRRATSDSLGHFFVDVPPGKWLARVSKPGYGTQLASVTIPADSGRQIFVWLRPADKGMVNKEEFHLREMAQRIAWGGLNCSGAGVNSRAMCSYRPAYLTREDIVKTGFKESEQLAAKGAIQDVDPSCKAKIVQTGLERELWTVSADEVEWMEVYASKRESYAVTSDVIHGGKRISPPPSFAKNNCPTVFIWVRK